jgi:phosphate acetyltransferase
MMRVFENKTIDELSIGESAAITRTLHPADLRAFAAVTGNPSFDESFMDGQGVTQWAGALFSTIIGSKLPGPGSMIQSVSARFQRPVKAGEGVTATVTIKEIRKDQGIVLLDCRCTDGAGSMIAEGSFEAKAPVNKIRIELPEHDLDELVERCKRLASIPTGIVHPCSQDALLGAVEAADRGLIEAVLFGPEQEIRAVADALKVDLGKYRIVATADAEDSAAKAAAMAGAGEIRALMKGSLHTNQYMHAVLHKENKLRTGRLLSHCMLIAAPTYARRVILSDVAVNITPDVDQKKDIIQNAILLAHAIGISEPKVAVLSAVETVRTSMASTMEAAALAKMADRRQIVGGIVDGPLDLDIAVDAESARIKGVTSPVAGVADILIAPDIDAGNMMYKELSFMGKAQVAGIVMGAKVPVILTSRSDSAEARLFSTALAVLFADATAKNPGLLHPKTSE